MRHKQVPQSTNSGTCDTQLGLNGMVRYMIRVTVRSESGPGSGRTAVSGEAESESAWRLTMALQGRPSFDSDTYAFYPEIYTLFIMSPKVTVKFKN